MRLYALIGLPDGEENFAEGTDLAELYDALVDGARVFLRAGGSFGDGWCGMTALEREAAAQAGDELAAARASLLAMALADVLAAQEGAK